jgi:hypothetical protein
MIIIRLSVKRGLVAPPRIDVDGVTPIAGGPVREVGFEDS